AALTAVDLEIEQRGRHPARLDIHRRANAAPLWRPYAVDDAVGADDVNDFTGRIMTSTQSHQGILRNRRLRLRRKQRRSVGEVGWGFLLFEGAGEPGSEQTD